MHHTKFEQETIITYNNAEDTMEFYTYDKKAIRRLLELSEEYPDECYQSKPIREGGYTFALPKHWNRINPPRKISEEQKQRQIANLQKAREKRKKDYIA